MHAKTGDISNDYPIRAVSGLKLALEDWLLAETSHLLSLGPRLRAIPGNLLAKVNTFSGIALTSKPKARTHS